MLLLIDAGNTRLKWALLPGTEVRLGAWQASGAAPWAEADSQAAHWRQRGIARVLVANVAGSARRAELERLLAAVAPAAQVEWFAAGAECGGLRNRYREPAQLGCDRFAAAIGAHALWPGRDLVVATCGTATTVDAVAADGIFLGGMILPGLELMAAALAGNTAQLPRIAHDGARVPVFADNTSDAITSGCIAAQAGAIERAAAAFGAGAACLLSGGGAHLVAPHLNLPHHRIDNLVLVGLQVVMTGKPAC